MKQLCTSYASTPGLIVLSVETLEHNQLPVLVSLPAVDAANASVPNEIALDLFRGLHGLVSRLVIRLGALDQEKM